LLKFLFPDRKIGLAGRGNAPLKGLATPSSAKTTIRITSA
jgi:hypothetical protein